MKSVKKGTLVFNILVLLLITKPIIAQNANPTFCSKGIIEFFKIIDILKQDKSPTEEDWNQFNSSPGYKDLTEREFGKNYLRDLMTVAFKPSEQKNKNVIIDKYKNKGDYYMMFAEGTYNSFIESDKYRADIIDFINYISTPEFIKGVEHYVSEFISNARFDSTMRINFIVFDDSRGYEQIIIGITNPRKYTIEEESCLKTIWGSIYFPTMLLMAHESFHNIREKQIKLTDPDPNSGDQRIVEILNSIEDEGIADQINVSRLYSNEGCLSHSNDAQRIIQEQKYQYAIIHSLDYFLTEISLNESLKQDLSKTIESIIARSGHPTGDYIAKTIASQLGNEELKRISLNPFQFIISYNKAAKALPGTPQFSETAIDFIKKLETKYLINK
ncbi:MAG TPA: DUF5700 domain-containing putative Zn-dependent protease [Bacteroidales bacterium]|nr:DUF5700 domain-containing putative Zn-dependent protease [Bacteroidales bacterium]